MKCLQSIHTCHICLWPLIKHGKLIWVILYPVPERLVRERNSKLVSEEVLQQLLETCIKNFWTVCHILTSIIALTVTAYEAERKRDI